MNRISQILIALSIAGAVAAGIIAGFKPPPAEREDATGALQALDFWTRARAYPRNDIPPGKYASAVRHVRQTMKRLPPSVNGNSVWTSIGPMNLSGRALSVAVNPQNSSTVYVGSASGGLWRSYTAGLEGDWQRVPTGYPVLGVGAIAFVPHDSTRMYIGTGEVYQYRTALGGLIIRTTRGSYGIGILKSIDGGKSWQKSLDWSMDQEAGVDCIRINPLNPSTLLAGTSEGILKSTDAGTSWTNVLPYQMAEDILINPQDTTTAIAVVGNFNSDYAGLYYSFDAGDDWYNVPTFPAFSGKVKLEMYQASPNVVYASVADSTTSVSSLWRSTNFGASWREVNGTDVAGVQGWYSHYVAVHPNDSSQIIRGGIDIFKSVTGGSTFFGAAGSYSDHHGFAHDPNNPDIIYDANDDGLYRSTDFGETYTWVSYGMQTGQFYNGFSCSSQDSLFAIGQVQDHIPGYSYFGSQDWGRTAVDECGWTAANPLNDHQLYAVDRNGGSVYRSTDRGNLFLPLYGDTEFGAWNTPVAIAPSNPSVLYFAKNSIHKSTDGGTTWYNTGSYVTNDGDVAISMAIAPTSPDTVFIGKAPYTPGHAHIYRTVNGGLSWVDVTGTLPDAYPLDIAIDPHHASVVYAAYGGFFTGHIFKSINCGISWTDISGSLPDIPVTAIAIDPQNSSYVYIGTDVGVEVSTDAGASWNDFSEGLPEAILVSDLVVSPSNRMLRVVTHGNGVYERPLPAVIPFVTLQSPAGGEHWDAVDDHRISWDEAGAPLLRLEISTDGGSGWTLIADSVNGFTRSYIWHTPYLVTDQAVMRISVDGNLSVHSQTPAPFALYYHGDALPVSAGWNMISLPVNPKDSAAADLFPGASSPLFSYTGGSGYSYSGTAAPGPGYWIRYASAQTVLLPGDSLTIQQIAVTTGWNLIGSIGTPIPAGSIGSIPPGIISGTLFTYSSSSGYVIADSITPGNAYWVNTTSAGTLTLSTIPVPAAGRTPDAEGTSAPTDTIFMTDDAGRTGYLLVTDGDAASEQKESALPPVPPEGAFDIRFAGDRFRAGLSTPENGIKPIPLSLRGIRYPLRVRCGHSPLFPLSIFVNGKERLLPAAGELVVAEPGTGIALGRSSTSGLPAAFALHQNYPNPFNPSTTVRFDLPVHSHVRLDLYSTLGSYLETVFEADSPAGSRSVVWNGAGRPSGVYFLRMTAGNFTRTEKIVLLR